MRNKITYPTGFGEAVDSILEGMPRKRGLRKISDEPKPCMSPEHNPPGHIVLSPGTYEYTCPLCGKTITFYVRGISL